MNYVISLVVFNIIYISCISLHMTIYIYSYPIYSCTQKDRTCHSHCFHCFYRWNWGTQLKRIYDQLQTSDSLCYTCCWMIPTCLYTVYVIYTHILYIYYIYYIYVYIIYTHYIAMHSHIVYTCISIFFPMSIRETFENHPTWGSCCVASRRFRGVHWPRRFAHLRMRNIPGQVECWREVGMEHLISENSGYIYIYIYEWEKKKILKRRLSDNW